MDQWEKEWRFFTNPLNSESVEEQAKSRYRVTPLGTNQ